MKRFLLILMLTVAVLSLSACNDKYKPVKSTEEELRTVMTLTVDGEEYEVKYELYRALFLNHKSAVDGGDSSVWSGADKDRYIDEINDIIISRASEIFGVLHLADKLGFAPYSKATNNEIEEMIKISIEGNSGDVVGFGGDYDAYLASLAEMNVNYSVQTLLIRYSLMLERINEYYIGKEDPALGMIGGEYEYTRDDVLEFYYSDDCRRILSAFVTDNKLIDAEGKINSIREGIVSASSDKEIALLIINNTLATPTDLLAGGEVSGIVMGRDVVSDYLYKDYRDAAFSLSPGEVSEVIKVGGSNSGYYLVYVLDKDSGHFDSCYETVKAAYLDNVVGGEIASVSSALADGAEISDGYSEIDHSSISMK